MELPRDPTDFRKDCVANALLEQRRGRCSRAHRAQLARLERQGPAAEHEGEILQELGEISRGVFSLQQEVSRARSAIGHQAESTDELLYLLTRAIYRRDEHLARHLAC